MPAQMNLYLQRNEDYAAGWKFTGTDDAPINLTGMTLALEVRDKLTQALVAAADIEITDASAGEADVILRASEGSPLSQFGNPIQTTNLHYDMRLTDVDGVHVIVVSGIVVLSRGETRT